MKLHTIIIILVAMLCTAVHAQPSNQPARAALSAADRERLEQKVSELQAYLQNNPQAAEAHLNLANAYWELGRTGKPIRHYYAAIKLNPNYAEAYYNLANVFFIQGEFEQAVIAYNKAISIKPEFAAAHNGLGNAYIDARKYTQAIEAYKKALLMAPGYNEVKYNLCSAYLYAARYNEAVGACQAASDLNGSKDARAYNNLGNAYFRLNRLDEALAAYRQATAVDSNLAEAHFNIGAIHLLQSDKSSATREKDILAAIDPQKSAKLGRLISEYGKH